MLNLGFTSSRSDPMASLRTARAPFLLAALALLSAQGNGRDITVEPGGPPLQGVLNAAGDGDRILLQPGTYLLQETLDFNQSLPQGDRPKDLVLQSTGGPEVTELRMNAACPVAPCPVVVFKSHETDRSSLVGLTLTRTPGTTGAGVEVRNSAPVIIDCAVRDHDGYGVYLENSPARLLSCRIAGNSSAGIACHGGNVPALERCTIARNRAGGVDCSNTCVKLESCTIADNERSGDGSAIYVAGCSPTVLGCVAWGNRLAGGARDDQPISAAAVVCYSLSDRDPLFVGAAQGDYGLQAGSPAIDRSAPCLPPDPDGTRADIGAHPFLQQSPRRPRVDRLLPGATGDDLVRAIEGAMDGDTILVPPGTYRLLRPLDFWRRFVTVRGEEGPQATVLELVRGGSCASDTDSAVVAFAENCETYSEAVLEGFTVRGGAHGILLRSAAPRIQNCIISDNVAVEQPGGGVRCEDAMVSLSPACQVESVARPAHAHLVHCTISGNAALSGGGVYNTAARCAPILESSIVWDNAGGSFAGTPPEVSHSCVEQRAGDPPLAAGNIALDPRFVGWADAVVVVPAGALDLAAATRGFSLALDCASPCRGSARDGTDMGAVVGPCGFVASPSREVHVEAGTYSVDGVSLAHRVTMVGKAPGVSILEGTVHGLRTAARLERLTVRQGGQGGVRVGGGEAPILRECTITENRGHGLLAAGGAPTLESCVLVRNAGAGLKLDAGARVVMRPAGSGCAAGEGGPAAVEDWCSRIESNGAGGVDASNSSLWLEETVVIANSGGYGGVGVVDSEAQATLVNCVIAGNWAPGRGGGFYLNVRREGTPLCLIHSAVTGNYARRGAGAIDCRRGSALVLNTIVWNNSPADTVGCAVPESAGNPLGVDPGFARAGGFAFERTILRTICGAEFALPFFFDRPPRPGFDPGDYHLGPDSPAVDNGVLPGTPRDLEGTRRFCGLDPDSGPYELCADQPPVVPFRRGDTNADGGLNLSDPVRILLHLFRGGEPLPCARAGDQDDNGQLELTDAVYLLNYLFRGGPAPQAPFAECGLDATPDELTCLAFDACPLACAQ